MTNPVNIELERAILGAILIDDEIQDDVLETIKPDDFSSERHRQILQAMREQRDKKNPVDIITVGDAKDEPGWKTYVSGLVDGIGTAANWTHYAKELRKLAAARQGIKVCREVVQILLSGCEVGIVIDRAQQAILGLDVSLNLGSQLTARDLAHESIARYKDLVENGKGAGLPTGYYKLDAILGGGFRKLFVIIGGRPGQGKTAFASNMLLHQALSGHCVGFISLEMSRDQIWDRLIALIASINTVKLDSGCLNGEDWSAIVEANSILSRCKIILDDSPGGQPVAEIRRICRQLKKRGAEIIYIDQLSKIRGKGQGLYETNTHVVNELSPLAKELEIPIILLAQINREAVAQANKRPSLNHLKATGALEEDADIVLFVHREYEYTREEEKKCEAQVEVAKHRGGPTGVINLRWIGKFTKFEEAENV